jgi:hypothetical protein
MRRSRLIMLSCALLALGCSDLTSPSRLDGAWREEVTIAGGGLDFTLATNGDSITGTGSWSAALLEASGPVGAAGFAAEACCGGPVTVAGTTTQGDVTLTLSFVAIGNVVPPWSATFIGRLSDANTLAGTMLGAEAPVVFTRIR